MRLHFLIFAALRRIPFVALPYATKVASLLEDLNIPMPPIKMVTAGRLIAHIDRSWDQREEYLGRIEKALPGLKARAQRSHQIFMELVSSTGGVERRAETARV